MSYLVLACAVALVGVFGVSASGKLGGKRFRVFVTTAGPLELMPRRWRAGVATAVVGAELAIVVAVAVGLVMVLFGLSRVVLVAGLTGAAVLLAGFTVAIGLLLRRGDRKPCHCFGVTDIPLGPAHLVRNLVLLALAVTGALARGSGFAVAGVALACVAGVVVAVLMVRFDDLVTLFAPPDPAGHLR